MAQHRVIQLLKLVVAQRAGNIDAGNLRANIGAQRVMLKRSLIVLLHARASGAAATRAAPVPVKGDDRNHRDAGQHHIGGEKLTGGLHHKT